MQARCKHGNCNGLMQIEYDRIKCVKCGRSIWRNFEMRKPSKDDRNLGCPPGSRNTGKDHIEARIR